MYKYKYKYKYKTCALVPAPRGTGLPK